MTKAGEAGGWRTAALRLAAAMTTGAALAAAFPAPDIGPLALLALVPLLLVVETTRPRLAGALGYVAGLTFFGLHLLWIAEFLSWTGGVAWLAWGALSAVQAVFVAAFFALVPATRRLGPLRLLVLPACWATLELLRAHQPLGGFPWGLLALTQHDAGPLLPLARVIGGYGVAAVIVAVNLAAAFWLRAVLESPAPAAAGATGGDGPAPEVAAADGAGRRRPAGLGGWRRLAVLVGLPVLVAGLIPARVLVPAAPPPSGRPLDVVVVQGGLRGGHGLALGQTTQAVFANHVRLTERLALTPGPPADLVVWGEGAADQDPLASADRLAEVTRAAGLARAPVLLGATTRVDRNHFATEALLFTPGGQLANRYRKRRLVPFGEYVPFAGLLGRLIPATREGVPSDKVPGDRLEPLPVDGVGVGTLICWESAYVEDARQLTTDGAQVLLVMTNNASFGDGPGSRQHLATSQLRAVEEGRSVVHAAVTGISAVVGPDGRTSSQTGLYQQTTVRAGVLPSNGLTPYTRFGRAIEAGLLGVAVAGVLAVAFLWWLGRRARLAGVGGRPGPSADRLVLAQERRGSRPAAGSAAPRFEPGTEARPAGRGVEGQ
ncbi:MAG TPA: apolipoprotein N-acyltransferase [Actinomycetota bacterium]|nr:apolipoprotein N-acyltransferase [Actinomycetota bacterium]